MRIFCCFCWWEGTRSIFSTTFVPREWNYFFISKDLTPRARPGGRCSACSRCSASSSWAIIQERIAAGMARAKAKGTKSGKPIGRPRIALTIKDRIRAAHRAGGASLRDLAARFGVGRETVRHVLCGGD